MDERVRSTEDIRQDIAREEENLSRTAHQMGDLLKEKLDVGEYVKDSPYWAMGVAVGIGFFASRVLRPRMTPMERLMGSLAGGVRGSLEGLLVRTVAPILVKVTLLGFGTKLAARRISNAISTSGESGCVSHPAPAESVSTGNPTATT